MWTNKLMDSRVEYLEIPNVILELHDFKCYLWNSVSKFKIFQKLANKHNKYYLGVRMKLILLRRKGENFQNNNG